MKLNRVEVQYFKQGEETGGIIIGRWLTNDPDKKDWHKFEILESDLVQLGNRFNALNLKTVDRLKKKFNVKEIKGAFIPSRLDVILKVLPVLLKKQLADPRKELIGIWHIQVSGMRPSPQDYEAMKECMRRLGLRRFVLGTGYISKKNENWFQKINFETCWV